jgi:hypothetical protein
MINRVRGFVALYFAGFAPSRIPPCGGALVRAGWVEVAVLLTAEAMDDMTKMWEGWTFPQTRGRGWSIYLIQLLELSARGQVCLIHSLPCDHLGVVETSLAPEG